MPGTLVLLRHGESTWNAANLFTGWYDADLSERGIAEATRAGALLGDAGLLPDVQHTSLLIRAIRTTDLALDGVGRRWIPVRRSWRLNERHYGGLQGKNKKETADEFGADAVKVWRRSYDTPPPAVDPASEHHPSHDPRYAALPPDVLPASECLKDVLHRMLPWWHDMCVPDLRAGRTTLVGAHGNSLRALVKHLDGISDADIVDLNIPYGNPLVYTFDDSLRPVDRRYLDPDAAAAVAAEVAAQAG